MIAVFKPRKKLFDGKPEHQAISIAAIMQQYQMPHVDLLKIDIEGAEKEVLENNTGWIEKTKTIIL